MKVQLKLKEYVQKIDKNTNYALASSILSNNKQLDLKKKIITKAYIFQSYLL